MISNKYFFKPEPDYYSKWTQNSERDIKGVILLLLPFIDDKNNGELLKEIVDLNQLFYSKAFAISKYDKEKLLQILKESPYKTNEYTTQIILNLDGEKVYHKNFDEIQEKGNIFNLSGLTQMHDLDDWTVPFYDTKTGNINFIVWNSKKETPINVSFIINQSTLITINNVKKYEWKITDGENINNINEILTIVDNKIKQHIDISTPELKEKFKRNNQTQYNDSI